MFAVIHETILSVLLKTCYISVSGVMARICLCGLKAPWDVPGTGTHSSDLASQSEKRLDIGLLNTEITAVIYLLHVQAS